jgi:hypothetical protein
LGYILGVFFIWSPWCCPTQNLMFHVNSS